MKKKEMKIMLLLVLLLANIVVAVLLGQSILEKKHLETQYLEHQEVSEPAAEEINMKLPETVYAAKGVTMELYNSLVTDLGENITKYNVLWKCEAGENLERKFSVTADENNLGTYELSLEIYDNQLQLVAAEKCTLKIVEEDLAKKEISKNVFGVSDIPAECLEQVKICVDPLYNGTLEELEPEGQKQLQDAVYSVLCGMED